MFFISPHAVCPNLMVALAFLYMTQCGWNSSIQFSTGEILYISVLPTLRIESGNEPKNLGRLRVGRLNVQWVFWEGVAAALLVYLVPAFFSGGLRVVLMLHPHSANFGSSWTRKTGIELQDLARTYVLESADRKLGFWYTWLFMVICYVALWFSKQKVYWLT